MENNFSGVRINDKVFHVIHGYGTVVGVVNNSFKAEFINKGNILFALWFLFDGKLNSLDRNPSVFWNEVIIIPPSKPKRKVEKIIKGWLNLYPSHIIEKNTIVANSSFLYQSERDADERSKNRLGEAVLITHKYTVEE